MILNKATIKALTNMEIILTYIKGYFVVTGVAYVVRLMYAMAVCFTHKWWYKIKYES